MSDTPDESTDSIPVAEPAPAASTTHAPVAETATVDVPPHTHQASRLNKIAAWVGIVAGAVVIVAVIFFTGFALGAHSGGEQHRHRGDDRGGAMEHRGGPPMFQMGPMMRPGPAFEFPGVPGNLPGGPGGSAGPGGQNQGPSTQPGR